MITVNVLNASSDMSPHDEVVTTSTCGHLVGKATSTVGIVTYTINVGEDVQGEHYGDLIAALGMAGCPIPDGCLADVEYELDYLSSVAAY